MNDQTIYKNHPLPISSNTKQLRPFSGNPSQVAQSQKGKDKENDFSQNSSLNNITESEVDKSQPSVSSKEQSDFLNNKIKGEQKLNFENLIKEEADRIDKINQQQSSLNTFNLWESNINGLYDWKTLFNKSRPLSSYTKINAKNTISDCIENKDTFKFPVALIDRPESEVNQYIFQNEENQESNSNKNKAASKGKSKDAKKKTSNTFNRNHRDHRYQTMKGGDKRNTLWNKKLSGITVTNSTTINTKEKLSKEARYASGKNLNNPKITNNGWYTRPKSVYAIRDPSDTFYLSKAFSDYFIEDFKTFTEKMPLLKAKIPIKTRRLQRAIKSCRVKELQKQKTLGMITESDRLVFKNRDIVIAAESGNAKPLLKSIYLQMHQNDNSNFDPIIKYYKNTSKPLGNNYGEIDYNINNRSDHISEFIRWREGSKNILLARGHRKRSGWNIRNLQLDTYDNNDPQLRIFTQIKETTIEDVSFNENSDVDDKDRNINTDIQNTTKEHTVQNTNDTQSLATISKTNKRSSKNPKLMISAPQLQVSSIQPKRMKSYSNPKGNFKKINRPFTANYKDIAISETWNKIQIWTEHEPAKEYLGVKSLPLRTNSSVPNWTYQKIQKRIIDKHEKAQNLLDSIAINANDSEMFNRVKVINHRNWDYSSSSRNSDAYKNIQFENMSIRNKLNEISSGYQSRKFDENIKNNHKCSYFNFNDYIDTMFSKTQSRQINKDTNYFYPMNYFNKNSNKYYSVSNNYSVVKKESQE